MALLNDLNQNKKISLIVVTHSNEVAVMARRIITLKDGRVIEDRKNI